MRDPKRIDKILEIIGDTWKQYPDQRFCQLLVNIGIIPYGPNDNFNVEDDILEKHLLGVQMGERDSL